MLLLIEPESGLIGDANDAAARFYGYPRDTLIGMHMADINTLIPTARAARRQVVNGEQTHFNERHRLADGELRDVEIYSAAVETGAKRCCCRSSTT